MSKNDYSGFKVKNYSLFREIRNHQKIVQNVVNTNITRKLCTYTIFGGCCQIIIMNMFRKYKIQTFNVIYCDRLMDGRLKRSIYIHSRTLLITAYL